MNKINYSKKKKKYLYPSEKSEKCKLELLFRVYLTLVKMIKSIWQMTAYAGEEIGKEKYLVIASINLNF